MSDTIKIDVNGFGWEQVEFNGLKFTTKGLASLAFEVRGGEMPILRLEYYPAEPTSEGVKTGIKEKAACEAASETMGTVAKDEVVLPRGDLL